MAYRAPVVTVVVVVVAWVVVVVVVVDAAGATVVAAQVDVTETGAGMCTHRPSEVAQVLSCRHWHVPETQLAGPIQAGQSASVAHCSRVSKFPQVLLPGAKEGVASSD